MLANRLRPRTALVALALGSVVLGLGPACGGGESGDATPTAGATIAPTSTVAPATTSPPQRPTATSAPPTAPIPTAGPTEVEAPHAQQFALLPEEGQWLKDDRFEITIGPSSSEQIDPTAMAGDSFTSCAAFGFHFSWQVRDPYPAPAGVTLQVYSERMGHRELVAEGTEGLESVGCSQLTLMNNGPMPLTVEIYYVVTSLAAGP